MDPIDLIKEGKINRYFRATQKLLVPNLVSHITQRAAGKDSLFIEDNDYLFMLSLMKEICLKFDLDLYAFCLMPNHTHLLLRPKRENLHEAMRDLYSRYARWFNKKYERKGHLFGGPYRQAVCLDDSYLLAISLYIHTNPVRASLVKEPMEYRWSSIRLYYEDHSPKSFVDPSFILGLLPGDNSTKRENYRQLLRKGAELKGEHVLEEEKAIYHYKESLAKHFPSIFRGVDESGKMAKSHGLPLMSLRDLEKMIEEIRESKLSNTPQTRKAKKYLIEQLLARGYKRSEIAAKFGISRKTVYNLLQSA